MADSPVAQKSPGRKGRSTAAGWLRRVDPVPTLYPNEDIKWWVTPGARSAGRCVVTEGAVADHGVRRLLTEQGC